MEARDVAGLEQRLAALVGSMRDTTRLLRALAPVAAELREMEAALRAWQRAMPDEQALLAHPSDNTHASGRRVVSVAVARMDGPIDPGVIERALRATPGVFTARVTHVDRTRLTVDVETDRPPADLALHDALLAVFSEGVSGGWNGDAEFIAVVGPVRGP
jgi:hypothetical protein